MIPEMKSLEIGDEREGKRNKKILIKKLKADKI